jgi:hypothetical protein
VKPNGQNPHCAIVSPNSSVSGGAPGAPLLKCVSHWFSTAKYWITTTGMRASTP